MATKRASAWAGRLESVGLAVSMDGRGRCLDNVFVEWLWRSVKYEEVYLHRYEAVPQLVSGLERYFAYYNEGRPHQSLGYRTLAAVYESRVVGRWDEEAFLFAPHSLNRGEGCAERTRTRSTGGGNGVIPSTK